MRCADNEGMLWLVRTASAFYADEARLQDRCEAVCPSKSASGPQGEGLRRLEQELTERGMFVP